ncbi:MAG: ankyrin repeat domain-containing protein [Ignavibacteria bacterium]|nr:ankyrin repeat domain-containing protein [Ignavibacteria bacterium]
MDHSKRILTEIEILSAEGIRDCFEKGVTPDDLHRGRPLFDELTGGYMRGPAFKECVKIFAEYGMEFGDDLLLSVLTDDAELLDRKLSLNSELAGKKYTIDCAFTPLHEASLLHICAEFSHAACAEVLIRRGADVNEKAGIDAYGFGGQTPVFHTVNQHRNASIETMKLLIRGSADLHITVRGLIWGKGRDWETYIPSVNPVSYAMMGLLRQFQRTEEDTYETVRLLMESAYKIDYLPENIPNKYLNKDEL